MIVTSCYHKSKGKTARMEKNRVFEVQDEFMHTKKIIFAELFILQNKIQTKFDKWIGEISSKQFLILIIVAAFPMPPSLTEVALRAGCSRQNIKKVAAVLEKKGFISLSVELGRAYAAASGAAGYGKLPAGPGDRGAGQFGLSFNRNFLIFMTVL